MDFWVLWLMIIFILTVLEVSTVSLVSIWFIASAIISLFISFFIDSFYIQFAIFAILGLILMLTTRSIVNKWIKPKHVKTNLDRVIGMEAIVTETINKNDIGEVKVDGKRWSAVSKSEIEKGTSVIVEAIEGVKLIVRKGVL